MEGSPATAVTLLLDDILEFSPALVQSRQVLPAVDWRHARPAQVEQLVARLRAAGMIIPQWLAIDLISAGHTLPASLLPESQPALRILSALNCPSVKPEDAAALARDLEHASCMEQLQARMSQQIIARLTQLGLTDTALRVALLSYVTAPEGLRAVRSVLDNHIATLPPKRLRVAGTSSTQSLVAALKYTFARYGACADITDCGYGSVMRELTLGDDPADALVVLLDQSYFLPEDWRRDPGRLRADLDERLSTLTDALKIFCARTEQDVFVTALPPASTPSAGFADLTFELGAGRVCAHVNQALAHVAEANALIRLIDTVQALAPLPASARHDPKIWFYGRFAYAEAATRHIAAAVARQWHLGSKGPAKVLALDFDNTLWGGVYGDDGLSQLQCGDDFPGSAYKAFQRECLRLKSQGMILVGLSKNNPDAIEVFGSHPGMLLQQDDFVAAAVDWNSKAENIRRMASDLGLGLDAFLFLDDSPHEREAMRRVCPEVQCPEMPSDPAMRPDWLRALPATWPSQITAEDTKRSGYYNAELKSRQLRNASGSYDAYLAGLVQQLAVQPMNPATLPRIVQLHQRTNQFNLTTARFTASDLSRPAAGNHSRAVYSGHLQDRFGDHGLVVAAAVDIDGDQAVIRSFVMSCRVIGRTIECAFLVALLRQLKAQQVRLVTGLFIPSPKNAVAARLYADFGFAPADACDGIETWQLDLETWRDESSNGVDTIWSEHKC